MENIFQTILRHNQTLKTKIFFQKMISAPSKHFRSEKKNGTLRNRSKIKECKVSSFFVIHEHGLLMPEIDRII